MTAEVVLLSDEQTVFSRVEIDLHLRNQVIGYSINSFNL